MIGLSRFTGTHRLPGMPCCPLAASLTISDPTPSRLPSSTEISAAPLQLLTGGKVKIAVSSRYSQPAAKVLRDSTKISVASGSPWPSVSTRCFSRTRSESPSAIGRPSTGSTVRTSPKPVVWS